MSGALKDLCTRGPITCVGTGNRSMLLNTPAPYVGQHGGCRSPALAFVGASVGFMAVGRKYQQHQLRYADAISTAASAGRNAVCELASPRAGKEKLKRHPQGGNPPGDIDLMCLLFFSRLACHFSGGGGKSFAKLQLNSWRRAGPRGIATSHDYT